MPTIPTQSSQHTFGNIIPRPVSAHATSSVFTLTSASTIYVEPGNAEMVAIGQSVAGILGPATGFPLEVRATIDAPSAGNLYLTLATADNELGDEGYELTITPDTITIQAALPAGVFYGIQTLRQLFPPAIEQAAPQSGPWQVPTGVIRDYPRYTWRGAMLDVARHFFTVEQVKRFIDLLVYYKFNRFHLHLTDDQGWRLWLNSRPNLARHGGASAVGGGPGGYYTQEQYAEIIAYAASRYILVIPEIDMPGHTHAALASYPELTRNGAALDLYTAVNVGTSCLCIDRPATFEFVEQVICEVAALTPGKYLHVGGDEAFSAQPELYSRFMEHVQCVVNECGKQMIGWEEIAKINLAPTTIVQHWTSSLARKAAEQGAKIIMSPASRAYMDMQYTADVRLGQHWAGYTEVEHAYTWEPSTQVEGIGEVDILGVEAPLWTETLQTTSDLEYMLFPRLPGYAEIGWSPSGGNCWEEYRERLSAHGERWKPMGIHYYPSPQVDWNGRVRV